MSFTLRALLGATLCLLVFGPGRADAQEKDESGVVEAGSRVSIEYTVKLSDGSVADSNVGGEPTRFVHGQSEILPAVESKLLGMQVGESKKIELSAAEGFGEVDPELLETVPASALPEGALKVGTQLYAQTESGEPLAVRVHELKGEEVVMDYNHPLAGKPLVFEVKVLSIE